MYSNNVPECMNKYLENFVKEFSNLMKKEGNNFRAIQEEQRALIYTSRFNWFLYVAVAIFGFIQESKGADLASHYYNAAFMLVVTVLLVIRQCNEDYKKAVKKVLYPKLLKTFSKEISYYTEGGAISYDIFDKSKLLRKEVCHIDTDETKDSFGGIYNGVFFNICETEVTWDNGKTGRDQTVSTLFNGLALYFKLEKEIDANIHIYSKSVFNRAPRGYEKVQFEYEKFNEKYSVYTRAFNKAAGQIEARYLLNVAFMERLMSLQTAFRVRKMRCSVYDDNMLILLYTTRDLFEINHLFRDVRDMEQYKHLFNEFASVLAFIDTLNLSSKTKL